MKHASKLLLATLVGAALQAGPVQASSDMEILLKILEKKGLVSKQEANDVINETKAVMEQQQKAQADLEKKVAKAEKSSGGGKWTWSGDLRARHDSEFNKNDPITHADNDDRHRQRLRARFGFKYDVNDKTQVGVVLATGSDDQASTNTTLDNSFSTKAINLDQAYAKHTFGDNVDVMVGKFKNPFKPYTWLVFDSDLRFEGVAVNANVGNGFSLKAGAFPLEESSGDVADAYMFAGQAGFKGKLTDTASIDAGLAYYHFSQTMDGGTVASSNAGSNKFGNNSLGTNPLHEFEVWNPTVKLGFDAGKHVGVQLDYVHNAAVDDHNNGWLVGASFGDKKVKDPGTWSVFATYSKLEADAMYESFVDSDFHGGGTNNKGYTFGYKYQIAKGWQHAFKWYVTEQETEVAGDDYEYDRIQADLKYKF